MCVICVVEIEEINDIKHYRLINSRGCALLKEGNQEIFIFRRSKVQFTSTSRQESQNPNKTCLIMILSISFYDSKNDFLKSRVLGNPRKPFCQQILRQKLSTAPWGKIAKTTTKNHSFWSNFSIEGSTRYHYLVAPSNIVIAMLTAITFINKMHVLTGRCKYCHLWNKEVSEAGRSGSCSLYIQRFRTNLCGFLNTPLLIRF